MMKNSTPLSSINKTLFMVLLVDVSVFVFVYFGLHSLLCGSKAKGGSGSLFCTDCFWVPAIGLIAISLHALGILLMKVHIAVWLEEFLGKIEKKRVPEPLSAPRGATIADKRQEQSHQAPVDLARIMEEIQALHRKLDNGGRRAKPAPGCKVNIN